MVSYHYLLYEIMSTQLHRESWFCSSFTCYEVAHGTVWIFLVCFCFLFVFPFFASMAKWLKHPTHNWRIRRFSSYWMHANGTLQ